MGGPTKIGERKFATWIQPRELSRAIPGDYAVGREAIYKRIEDGLIRAGARDAFLQNFKCTTANGRNISLHIHHCFIYLLFDKWLFIGYDNLIQFFSGG